MAHMSLFPGNHEIVEIEEELNQAEHYRSNNHMKPAFKREEKDRRSLASNAGHVSSIEDDLNQLFEMFNRRTSSHKSAHPNQAGTSSKNASKRPIRASGSDSPGHGISERVNLKQALRGLCLSQASEMAAMKRSMKSGRSSEAGKIMTLYRNVVDEDIVSNHSQDDGRGGMLEISLVPEETNFDSLMNSPENLRPSDFWPSNQSSLAERGAVPSPMPNERAFDTKDGGGQMSKPEKPASVTSLSLAYANDSSHDMGCGSFTQNGMISTSTEVGNRATVTEMLQKHKHPISPTSSSPTAKSSIQEVAKSTMMENGKFSASAGFASRISSIESSEKEKHASPRSPSCPTPRNASSKLPRKMPAQKGVIAVSTAAGNQMPTVDLQFKEENSRSPRLSYLVDRARDRSNSGLTENGKLSSKELSPQKKHESIHSPSHPSDGKVLELGRKVQEQKEMIPLSVVAGIQMKVDMKNKEEHTPGRPPRRSDLSDKALDLGKSSPASNKLVSKETAAKSPKAVQKDSSKTLPASGSPKGKKVSNSTKRAQHFVKPLIKTKNFVRRKSKKNLTSNNGSKNTRCEFNNDLYSSPNPIVCPRCQCVVTDAWKEANQESPNSHQESRMSHRESSISHEESPMSYRDSPVSPFASLSAEVSSGNVISDVSTPGPSSDSLNNSKIVIPEATSYSKLRDNGEFTHRSKGSQVSPGECSSSTSVSEESNLSSRPSFCNRPHMSKDVRWEAIRRVRFQQGTIGLRNFNLLKKLGCGDIGTVYLAELIGTKCLFAIKVMDNEFLARRKKISRAQTEKDILRILDHPFLPTLYCQFTSDNLSCLVMEYCPGGDLHVLRQIQPGRCFTEQAARFYVAEVLLALEYLHMLGVVYRDLKPENILVREDGHIMLSDFDLSLRCAVNPTLLVSSSMPDPSRKISGPCVDSRCAQPLCIEPSCQVTCFTPRLLAAASKSSRKLKPDLAAEMRPLLQLVAEPNTARSNSFVGTHEYLAPEIIKGEGHGSAVDWWTFGIFLYELLYGRTPFKGAGNEETLANVVLQTLKFPDSPLVSLQARDLIAALLVKEPESRLGTERGAAEIKQHPFFDGLNWALIRCAVPPELPENRSYGMPKPASLDKNNSKYMEFSTGSGEDLEFEVF